MGGGGRASRRREKRLRNVLKSYGGTKIIDIYDHTTDLDDTLSKLVIDTECIMQTNLMYTSYKEAENTHHFYVGNGTFVGSTNNIYYQLKETSLGHYNWKFIGQSNRKNYLDRVGHNSNPHMKNNPAVNKLPVNILDSNIKEQLKNVKLLESERRRPSGLGDTSSSEVACTMSIKLIYLYKDTRDNKIFYTFRTDSMDYYVLAHSSISSYWQRYKFVPDD